MGTKELHTKKFGVSSSKLHFESLKFRPSFGASQYYKEEVIVFKYQEFYLNLACRENGIVHLSERDCETIITYFDSDEDNGLNYKE